MDKSESIDSLFKSIQKLDDLEEYGKFFYDILTIQELKTISQRLEVARMLKNESTYNEIAEKTGASTATVSRVNRSLRYGLGGFDIVFDREKNN